MDYYFISEEDYKIAESNGISRNVVYQRVNSYCWSIKRAITEPIKKLKKHYPDILDKALSIGVSREAYYNRLKIGWSIEKASSTPIMSKEEIYENNSKKNTKYPEYKDLAEKNGVPYSTFKRRVRTGWDIKDAYTIKPMSKSEAGKINKSNNKYLFLNMH